MICQFPESLRSFLLIYAQNLNCCVLKLLLLISILLFPSFLPFPFSVIMAATVDYINNDILRHNLRNLSALSFMWSPIIRIKVQSSIANLIATPDVTQHKVTYPIINVLLLTTLIPSELITLLVKVRKFVFSC